MEIKTGQFYLLDSIVLHRERPDLVADVPDDCIIWVAGFATNGQVEVFYSNQIRGYVPISALRTFDPQIPHPLVDIVKTQQIVDYVNSLAAFGADYSQVVVTGTHISMIQIAMQHLIDTHQVKKEQDGRWVVIEGGENG